MILNKDWQHFYIELAEAISKKSKDGSSKFGAILVRPDKTVASIGFNGFPARLKDIKAYLNKTTFKEEKYFRIVHAEANCLNHNRDHDTTGYHLFVNGLPCSACALRIVSTGIKYVYYSSNNQSDYETRWADSIKKSKTLFEEAGVELIEVDLEAP